MAIADAVTKSTEINAAALAIVTEVLTEVTDPVLRCALADKVVRAVRLRRRLEGCHSCWRPTRSRRAPSRPSPTMCCAPPGRGLPAERFTYYSGRAQTRHDVLRQVTAVADLLTAGTVEDVPAATPTWVDALGGLGALAVRAAALVTGEQERAALTQLVSTLAGTILSDPGQAVRVLTVTWDEAPPESQRTVQRDGGQVTVLLPERSPTWYAGRSKQWRRTAVQLSPDGRFTPPSGATVEAEIVAAGWRGADRIAAFCRLLAEQGPARWRAECVDDLVQRTGMTRAEAALLLAGLPGIDEWQANFLTAEQRRILGVNTTQARGPRRLEVPVVRAADRAGGRGDAAGLGRSVAAGPGRRRAGDGLAGTARRPRRHRRAPACRRHPCPAHDPSGRHPADDRQPGTGKLADDRRRAAPATGADWRPPPPAEPRSTATTCTGARWRCCGWRTSCRGVTRCATPCLGRWSCCGSGCATRGC
ncbi:hypothetical protein V2I01_29720 [Micromonospora sp. BRA006-A]|nr:hypothetical protein [Micromonospora sp. BRA006-A]